MTDETTGSTGSGEAQESDFKGSAGDWLDRLKKAGKKQSEWEQRADEVVEKYRDEAESGATNQELNMLWSNTQNLLPQLYSNTPKPVVTRRYKDKDKAGMHASRVLERALEFTLDAEDFDSEGEAIAEDYALPGRGTLRVDYKAEFGPKQQQQIPVIPGPQQTEGGPVLYVTATGQPVDGETVQVDQATGQAFTVTEFEPLLSERAFARYVYWKDFRHGPAKKWKKVPWVAFREYMDRDELIGRFGQEIGDKIPVKHRSAGNDDDNDAGSPESEKKAEVWEIWDKRGNMVHWLCPDYQDEFLDQQEPHLKLNNFFPCPRPAIAVKTNGTLQPIPEYCQYQNQADQLNTISKRIDSILPSLKVVGCYAADAEGVDQMLDESTENVLIPIKDWAMFTEKGGLDGAISWYPVRQVLEVLRGLYLAKDAAKQELFELSGFSDLMRGQSDPNETATAQGLKGQFIGRRLNAKSKDVAIHIRDTLRLLAEVIAENFSPETLSQMTGLEVDQNTVALLQNDTLRTFRIDIETESTVESDEKEDRQARIEFVSAVSDFIHKTQPLVQASPQTAPILTEFIMFVVRGFRKGRELEDKLEEALEQMSQAAQQPKQPSQQQQLESAETKAEIENTQADTMKKAAEADQTRAETATATAGVTLL